MNSSFLWHNRTLSRTEFNSKSVNCRVLSAKWKSRSCYFFFQSLKNLIVLSRKYCWICHEWQLLLTYIVLFGLVFYLKIYWYLYSEYLCYNCSILATWQPKTWFVGSLVKDWWLAACTEHYGSDASILCSFT